MSERSKAIELVTRFLFVKDDDNRYAIIDKQVAKQCALICVDEIDIIYQKETPNDDAYLYLMQLEYWQQVKQEINNL